MIPLSEKKKTGNVARAVEKEEEKIYGKISKDLEKVGVEQSGFATRASTESGFTAAATLPEHDKGKLRRKVHYSVKSILKQAVSLKASTADSAVIRQRFNDGGRITGMNLIILFMAIIIASVGLNMNSTAVIIGAMLISPIMGTIQLMGFSIATVDSEKFKKAIIGFTFQVVVALIGSTIYFLLTPIKAPTAELLARTKPAIWDVLIATAGGFAGAVATTRKDTTSNVIPGVAIATALMPPLCTCGYSIANGKWNMLLGAGFLFLINMFFIIVSTVLVLLIIEIPEVTDAKPEMRKRMRGALIRNTILILIPSIIMAVYITKESNLETASRTTATRTASTAQVTDQLKILFPEIDSVQVGRVEEEGEDGKVQEKDVAIISLKEELSDKDKARLERYIATIYENQCEVEYRLEEPAAADVKL